MLILASGSPRRKMLLESAGYRLKIEPAEIDETHAVGEEPHAYVERVSREKALAVAKNYRDCQTVILAADTIVVLDGEILGKPASEAAAREMLEHLSGHAHSVLTGVCIVNTETGNCHQFISETRVHFCTLSAARIDAYIATGEPMDKAGAYGIQGRAASFVSHIEGSYTNVVGLPLCETVDALEKAGCFAE